MTSFDVFLCHNGDDKAVVRALAEKLTEAGVSPWFDAWQIRGGDQYADRMAEGLAASRTCAVCIGPAGRAAWDVQEARLAIRRQTKEPDGFRVIPVLLPGLPDTLEPGTLNPYLELHSRVDLRAGIDDPDGFTRLLDAIAAGTTERSNDRAARPTVSPSGARPLCVDQGGRKTMPAPLPPSSRRTEPAHLSYLTENLPILQQHLKDLTFTPIIGHGCSLVGRTRSKAWREVAGEMAALMRRLEGEPAAAGYLRSLAVASVYEVPLAAAARTADAARPSADSPIVHLQLALSRLGAQLGAVFASAMLASPAAVWSTSKLRVTVPHDDEALHRAVPLLIDACLAADELRKATEAADALAGLGSAGLYDRLVEMAGQLIDQPELLDEVDQERPSPDRHAVIDDIRAWRPAYTPRDYRPVGGVELWVHHLEWVADALWHTLRFDKAAHPRADELAFQISLLASGSRGGRFELVTAAEVGRIKLSAATVAGWFASYRSESPPKLVEFYDGLARILLAQMKGNQAHLASAAGPANQGLRGFQPVAFSMNFDLEMEHALGRLTDLPAFHVVIPVNAYPPEETEPELQWLFGTVRRGHPVEEPSWDWFPASESPRVSEIKGPIVVRLHGSPLHVLPDRAGDLAHSRHMMPEYDRLEHALVLSEREYLQDIVWKDPLPQYFNDIFLNKHRTLFFLGHSLDEWNTRLRLFSQVYRRDAPPGSGKRIAISRSHDPFRSAVLSGIGVHRWIGDLEEIARAVDGVLV